jgi:hypothetical protein
MREDTEMSENPDWAMDVRWMDKPEDAVMEFRDEFDAYLQEALRDPLFRILYQRAQARIQAHDPLAVNGREYRRRQLARRRRRR